MENINYCVFIDVLGYGSLVSDSSKTYLQKITALNSIYSNLASSLLGVINEINSQIVDKIFIKSFSDCFYLEGKNPVALMFCCERIFNDTFGFYSNFPPDTEYTPLIRGGFVKDWIIRFKDLGDLVTNREGSNPIGLGVARAYWTSEKSKISGMRLIISPEVIEDLELAKFQKNNYEFQVTEFVYHNVPCNLYIAPITINEENLDVKLYELIWTEEVMSGCTFEYVSQLKNIRQNFNDDSLRHFNKTAEVVLKGLLISTCNIRTPDVFESYRKELEEMAKLK